MLKWIDWFLASLSQSIFFFILMQYSPLGNPGSATDMYVFLRVESYQNQKNCWISKITKPKCISGHFEQLRIFGAVSLFAVYCSPCLQNRFLQIRTNQTFLLRKWSSAESRKNISLICMKCKPFIPLNLLNANKCRLQPKTCQKNNNKTWNHEPDAHVSISL